MTTEEISENPTSLDYLEYFGLEEDPFGEEYLGYFDSGENSNSGERGDQFSDALHFAQFSDALVGVVGPAGLGKNTFKQALVDRLDPEDVIVEMKAPLLSNALDFMRDVAENFGLSLSDLQEYQDDRQAIVSLIHLLRDYGSERLENDAIKFLIVEDAHNLDETTLKALTSLAIHQLDNQRCIRLILFGEPELSGRLTELENEKLLVQVFELKPLTKSELKHYLRFRLDMVGFEGIFPFKSEDIDYLWESSQGIPEKVHLPASHILNALSSPPPAMKSIGLPIPHIALISVLVVGLLTAVFYRSGSGDDLDVVNQSEENNFKNGVKSTALQIPKSLSSQESVIDAEKNSNENSGSTFQTSNEESVNQQPPTKVIVRSSSSVSQDNPVKRNLDQPANATKETIKEEANPSAAEIVKAPDVTTIKKDSVKPSAKQQTTQSSPQTASSESVEDTLISLANRSKLTVDESALLAMSDNSVTLQLLAGSSEKAAIDFVSNQENKSNLFIYTALRNDKTFYIVLEGNYSSPEQAKSAIGSLPAKQQQAGPWPRSLESVKGDIRQYRGL